MKFLRVTMLWITLLPLACEAIGAASNQLVLIANHDKFPVMLNAQKTIKYEPDDFGLIDDTHCVMTRETRLNFLADIFDFKDGIYSVGDGLIELGTWGWTWAPFLWAGLLLRKIIQEGD
jgi:Family of unknown function (DUF5317)